MNLIEQLGGYDKAKEITEDDFFKCFTHVSLNGKRGINEEFSFIPHLNEALKEMVRISDIKEALLKYRRQHNIFEVGDYYVYLYEWDSDLDIVFKFNPLEWGDHLWNIKNMIRHATDAEIKAGKRL